MLAGGAAGGRRSLAKSRLGQRQARASKEQARGARRIKGQAGGRWSPGCSNCRGSRYPDQLAQSQPCPDSSRRRLAQALMHVSMHTTEKKTDRQTEKHRSLGRLDQAFVHVAGGAPADLGPIVVSQRALQALKLVLLHGAVRNLQAHCKQDAGRLSIRRLEGSQTLAPPWCH